VPSNLQRTRAGGGENLGRAPVDLLPPRQHDLVGDRLLCQRVPPAVGGLTATDFFDHLLRDADCERALNGRVRKVGDGDEGRVVERSAEDGSGLQDLRLGRIEPRETQQDRVADRLGNPHLRQRAAIPALRGAEDVAAIDRLSEHLLEHERISLRACVHQVAELRPDLVVVEDRGDHLRDLDLPEGRQCDELRDARSPPGLQQRRERMPAVELVAAVGDEHERARVRQAAGDVVEQLARGSVGPVDVLDDEQQAALACRQREQTDDGLEEAKLGLRRVADGRVGLVAAEEREERRELPPCRAWSWPASRSVSWRER